MCQLFFNLSSVWQYHNFSCTVCKRNHRESYGLKKHFCWQHLLLFIYPEQNKNIFASNLGVLTSAREAYASKKNEIKQNLIDLKKKIEIANLGLQNTNSLPLHCFVTTPDRNYETTFHNGCIENSDKTSTFSPQYIAVFSRSKNLSKKSQTCQRIFFFFRNAPFHV